MERIYLFLIIVLTGTVWAAVQNGLILALSAVVLIFLFLKDNQEKFNVSLLLTYGTLSCLLAFIFLIHYAIVPLGNDPLRYIGLYSRFIMVGAFYVYVKNKQIDFAYLLQGILKWIAIHALVGFLLSFALARFTFPVDTESFHSNTFLYIFFYNTSFNVLGIEIFRTQGIFWEPGVLQIYMNILFLISSFIIRNRRLQLLSAFVILITYSTTGIGLLILQMLIILFTANIGIYKKTVLVLVLIAGAIPMFVINYSEKIAKNNDSSEPSEQTSSAFRAYDLIEGINMTRQYPLTGIGMSDKTYKAVKSADNTFFSKYSQEMTDLLLDRKNSNSVSYFFVRFGIPFALFWFFLLYKQDLFGSKKILFFILVIIEVNSEPLLTEPFFLLIAASGFYNLIKVKASSLSKYSHA